ncbi:MAG: ThiF family adenylyltransferase, partial [Chloroflexi bacterium]|nr:ThiF family adenylyltransferase [Chloroflexota bacterium]
MTVQHLPSHEPTRHDPAPSGAFTLPPHDEFYRQLVARNRGLIDEALQQRLRTHPLLIAGCGALGGAVVEPLVRLGAERLLIADAGTYELSDLGHASVRLDQLGRNKAEAAAEHVRAINPYATVTVEPRGITDATVAALVREAAVIVDGLGASAATLDAKRRLHRAARELRVPVVVGYDRAGRHVVVVRDYRRSATRQPRGQRWGAAVSAAGSLPGHQRSGDERLPAAYTAGLFGTLALSALLALIAG